jgi:hypothetical protein
MLRNRKQEEAQKLKGVDLIDDETDVQLGSFTSLQNYIPADVYAIKKKRGVSALTSDPIPVILAILTEDGEPILTEDGEQLLIE